jgi:hypothetical protein
MTHLGDTTVQTLPSVASAFHCQYQCLQSANCKFFSFNVTSKSCALKISGLNNITKIDSVSGPKICAFAECKYLTEFPYNVIKSYVILQIVSSTVTPSYLRQGYLSFCLSEDCRVSVLSYLPGF